MIKTHDRHCDGSSSSLLLKYSGPVVSWVAVLLLITWIWGHHQMSWLKSQWFHSYITWTGVAGCGRVLSTWHIGADRQCIQKSTSQQQWPRERRGGNFQEFFIVECWAHHHRNGKVAQASKRSMWACSVTLERMQISSSSPSPSVIIFVPGFPAKGWISELRTKKKGVIFWLGYFLGYDSVGSPENMKRI